MFKDWEFSDTQVEIVLLKHLSNLPFSYFPSPHAAHGALVGVPRPGVCLLDDGVNIALGGEALGQRKEEGDE